MSRLLRKRKGVIELSKIFKISGNYTQDGKWAEPDPAFAGEIVVDETGKFCGWCEELCGRYADTDATQKMPAKIRYLVGAVAKESEGYSLSFFKMTNEAQLMPLFYEIHGVSTTNGYWAARDLCCGFAAQGNARALLEELPYSEKDADRIKKRFREVDEDVNGNSALIREVGLWQQKNLVLWV